ncbi:DUF2130 domain-containing protein [Streptococcus mutans]|uniref:DUF2130 domain-containing protein n=1 Tax=Streptococcus mutans TaxID=1309 RepID=UPI0002B5AEDF|nr:hypothetical protein SMU54_03270 [Streptococcus mutans A9]
MNEIKCPRCGTVFTINETEYSQLLAQVRGAEFEKEIHERLERETALLEEKAKNDLQSQVTQKEQEITELSTQMEQLKQNLELESQRALSQKDQEIAALKAEIDKLQSLKDFEAKEALTNKEQELKDLTVQLEQAKQEALTLKDKELAEKNEEVAKLSTQLEVSSEQTQLKIKDALAEKDQELLELKAQLDKLSDKSALELANALSEKDKEVQNLQAQLDKNNLEHANTLQKSLADVEKERDEAQNQLALQEKEAELQLSSVRSDYEVQLKAANEQVEFYKNFKAQQSTKAIGESLEVYAESEFNKVRSYAFPNAYFGKDNEVSSASGSKGDFIFREADENGVEILSIMFEMKNEADTTKTKHKNSDFYKELDKDRREKKCEYAVLVTMLEADNDYFNTGIVDVSHEYEKMYVVRPQFFIQLIGLLRNAALNSLKYKQELALVREQNIDITHFEDDLETFKNAFAKNYNSASKNFQKAIDEIDKAIKRMEAVKSALTTSENQLRLANNKLDDVSVKKLTRKNPTMKAKFEALKE